MQINDETFIPLFKRANSILNRTLNRIDQQELSIRIHYWGFMPRHYDNTEHRHSFLKPVTC